jgi:tRNA(Ile)-lysidine synthase
MLSDFENYIQENQLFSKDDKLLLAMSGGQDSVFLFHLLLQSSHKFSVAHCNFQLRGAESDLDEQFVKNLCKQHEIECHIKLFDTKSEAKKLKLGTQEIARKLRYDWFEELRIKENYRYVLTAHHLSDNTETMLINMMRSTGISGLHGIQIKKGYLVRPLLYINRSEIFAYIKSQKIDFRHDKSNDSDNYLRNKIRHHIIPEFETIEPKIDEIFYKVSSHISEYEILAENLLNNLWEYNISCNNGAINIPDSIFKNIAQPGILLYYCLKKYGFNAASLKPFEKIDSIVLGAVIYSSEWQITRERNGFDLRKKESVDAFFQIINSLQDIAIFKEVEITFRVIPKNDIDFKQTNTLYLDLKKCSFPLLIRTWEAADKMQPLGLNGHKKISDILTDRKINTSDRKSQLVLLDGENSIIALMPSTCSEVHKISHDTLEALAICLKYH